LTYNELLAELVNDIRLPSLQDTDITINKLCEEGLTENAWRLRMKHLVDAGTWKVVYKRNSTGGRVQTFKKVL
jgi:hypothetical protein